VGAVNLPMVEGEISAIIPSLSSSVKMSSPLREIGSMTEDGKSGVIGRLGRKASTVPIEVRVESGDTKRLPFSVVVARHRRLLPMLATMAVSTALSEALPDVTDALADVTTRLSIRGFGELDLRDQVVASDVLTPRILAMSHGMRALTDLLGNPFSPVVVDRIEVSARVDYHAKSAEIVGLSTLGDNVRAGASLPLRVSLRPYSGAEFSEIVRIELPKELAGRSVKIEAAAGAKVQPEVARAENLHGFIDNLRAYYPASTLVLSLTTRDDSASLHGRLLGNLPPSAIDTLRPSRESKRAETFRIVKRSTFAQPRVLSGRQEIVVQVRDREESAYRAPN
jgi:hypothetical protein